MTQSPYENSFFQIDTKEHFPEWLNRVRQAAYHNFLEHDFPTSKHEAWKYLNLKPLLGEGFQAEPIDESVSTESIQHHLIKELPRIVLVNGHYSENLSSVEGLPEGVIFSSIRDNFDKLDGLLEKNIKRNQEPFTAFSDINTFSFEEGVCLYIPEGIKLEKPVHILSIASGDHGESFVYYPRVLVALEKEAKGSAYLQFLGNTNQKYFCNAVLDVSLDESAEFELIRNHIGSNQGTHFDLLRVEQMRKSKFCFNSITEGGALSRHEVQVDFRGEEAYCELNGLSVLDGTSEIFNHVTVNHHVPNCKSDQLYKNVLIEKSRTEFNGLVFVDRDAQKSDSTQLNKNLLLSDDAKAYSRPQLKIYADDVKCSHGSATGQLEEEQIFYLNSRGITREVANSMLTFGFAEEVIERVKDEEVRKRLESAAISKLIKVKY